MSTPNELRVFISSTFRDLQEEREHLVKKIFPEIRALCRERGVTFTEVDLRWGLTDEHVALGQVVRTCLEEVDRCRPYFIGITGDQYGFVPTYLDIQKDPELLAQYPWIEDAAMDQMSITEMEAQYGVLRAAAEGGPRAELENARFYFRRKRENFDDDPDERTERRRLEEYQERIQSSGASIERFHDPVSLGELIYDDLVKIIKRDFADAKPPTPLDQERSRHSAFSLSRRRAYIANPLYLKRLNDHAASDDPPLIVYAESGSGKSSLFAFWAEQYRRRNPDAHIIEHYVGIGATATDHYGVIRHVCMEINERFGRDEVIPTESAKLDHALGQWFGYADHALNERGRRMVLILDGLNQLEGTASGLRWIPDIIPPSIRLVLGSTVEGTLMELQRRGWSRFGIQALSEAERETIVVRYLAEFHKSLNLEQIKRIASDYKCGHALFLKTVLEELRLVGRHEELNATIESYLATTGTEDLFQRVLERLEDDYSPRSVRDVMTLLSVSRSGLDERELLELSGMARLKIATMVAGLDYHLVRKDGRLTFFHDYLRRAVQKRYLSDEGRQRSVHLQIADYFQAGVSASIAAAQRVQPRIAGELLYQLHACGATDRLRESLATMPVFLPLFGGETQYDVQRYWSAMVEESDVEGCYRRGLQRWEVADPHVRCVGLGKVAHLLDRLGRWYGAIEVERERATLAMQHGDRSQEADSRLRLGWLLYVRGAYDEALDVLTQALDLNTELGDQGGISRAIGYMGGVYASRGDHDRALECHQRALRIHEETDDLIGIAAANGNMGLVHLNRGEYDRALECFQRSLSIHEGLGNRNEIALCMGNMANVYSNRGEHQRALETYTRQLSICEELGDRAGVAVASGNMGNVYKDLGEYDRALECYRRSLIISTDLGDRNGIAVANGNIGLVYSSLGEYDRALECYQTQVNICRELGDPIRLFIAIGNMGTMSYDRGDHEQALEHFRRAADEHRAIGFRFGLTYWLAGIAQVLVACVQADGDMPEYLPAHVAGATRETWRTLALQLAREHAQECIAISDQLSKPDTRFTGQVLVARVAAAQGNRDAAIQSFNAMLSEATSDEQRAQLHYWLWKLGSLEHASAALATYEALFARTPAREYHRRIGDLRAAGQEA